MDAVIVATPKDYAWARDLAEQLEIAGYRVYLEPPEIDAQTRKKTIAAMREAKAMLAVVSTDAALGDSAEIFEQWWRSFADRGKNVVPCLPTYAPKGAKHWMPYDLYQLEPINFAETNAFNILTQRLGKPQKTLISPPPIVELNQTTTPQYNDESIEDLAPPPPSTPEQYPDIPDITLQPPQMGLLRYLANVVIGAILVGLVWGAATLSEVSLITWLGGIIGIGIILFLLGRIQITRRQQDAWLALRWQRAKQWSSNESRPLIYIEVVESPYAEEVSTIWELYGDIYTIGKSAHATLPLHKHKGLDAECAMITYENGSYILENCSQSHTIMIIDQPLPPSSTIAIHNGDLISLPNIGLVLQFRITNR